MIEAQERELLERSVKRAVAEHTGADLDRVLAELGWAEVLAADPRTVVSLLFENQGAAGGSSSALDQVLASKLGAVPVLPAIGRWQPPGRLEGDHLRIDGLASSGLLAQPTAIIVTSDRAFEIDPAWLPSRPIGGIDPDLHLLEISGQIDGAREVGPADWSGAMAMGQLALGHELVGASRRMLDLARQHALDRVQFGQPIARFQAVRHRLAETFVAIEAAGAALDAGWISQSPQLATLAKATAGRAARVTARHCQQVLAGVGFTTEHPLHRYVRRVHLLDQLLGAGLALSREVGTEILARRQLPPLLPL